jgi:transposase
MPSTFSVRQVAERYAVSEHVVLAWLKSGQLRGINVARQAGAKRPTWRIRETDLEAFEALRTPTPPSPRARRRKRPADVVKFY